MEMKYFYEMLDRLAPGSTIVSASAFWPATGF